jgi:hypothetical protein
MSGAPGGCWCKGHQFEADESGGLGPAVEILRMAASGLKIMLGA